MLNTEVNNYNEELAKIEQALAGFTTDSDKLKEKIESLKVGLCFFWGLILFWIELNNFLI